MSEAVKVLGARALPAVLATLHTPDADVHLAALAHLIALYQSPPKGTMIFEEPEKGIHPGALAVLAEQFLACAGGGRSQVLLTPHSPELLNHFPPEAIRLVQMRDSKTLIGPIHPNQVLAIKEQLLRPGELLTVDTPKLAEAAPAAD